MVHIAQHLKRLLPSKKQILFSWEELSQNFVNFAFNSLSFFEWTAAVKCISISVVYITPTSAVTRRMRSSSCIYHKHVKNMQFPSDLQKHKVLTTEETSVCAKM